MRALHTTIRRQHLIDSLLGALVAVLLLALYPSTALAASGEAPVNPAVLAKAVDQMEQLDRMRISLASTLEGGSEEPTMDTMREVCMPVGKRAMAIGQENGWTVRQVASKYRNPDHAPAGSQETEVIDLFAKHPKITGLWEPATAEQEAGVNYYRRIDVQPSCLACHGSKDSRPGFVKDKYPADKAFNFKQGGARSCAPSLALAHVQVDNDQVLLSPWSETDFRDGSQPWWA